MTTTTYTAYLLIASFCSDGLHIHDTICPDGHPRKKVEVSVLSGTCPDTMPTCQQVKYDSVAEVRVDGKVVASIPASALDEESLKAVRQLMDQISERPPFDDYQKGWCRAAADLMTKHPEDIPGECKMNSAVNAP